MYLEAKWNMWEQDQTEHNHFNFLDARDQAPQETALDKELGQTALWAMTEGCRFLACDSGGSCLEGGDVRQ